MGSTKTEKTDRLVFMGVRLPAHVRLKLEQLAVENERSASAEIRLALRSHLANAEINLQEAAKP